MVGAFSMKIIFCYNGIPDIRASTAILKYAPQTEFVETPGLFGYNEAIASRWGQDDLVIIEGDKEITSDTIPSFETCDEPWCSYGYYNYPEPYQVYCSTGLGCAKFSLDLQRKIPTTAFCRADISGMVCPDCNGAGCWRYLDTRIAFAIFASCISFSPHVHGEVIHHHTYAPDWAALRGLE